MFQEKLVLEGLDGLNSGWEFPKEEKGFEFTIF